MEMIDLLKLTYEKNASDLLLTVGSPALLRINGILEKIDSEVLTPKRTRELAYSILTKEQIEDFEHDKDLGMGYGIEQMSRYRINFYIQRGSVAVAARLIPFVIPTFEKLGLPEIVKDFSSKQNGLIIITGAVGSGKSTTLAAMIEYINQRKKVHIVTIEDPIEFLHQHKMSTIDQREVGKDAASFTDALRNVFRQTPDVIMVGEMRDLETMRLALTLAETGHLILATLHTQDATNSINRMIDVFPPAQQQQIRIQISMVLQGVMVQQLIPHKEKNSLVLGYEIMNVNNAIRNLIRENHPQQIYSVLQTAKAEGMITMNDTLERLFKEGRISFEDAVNRSPRPKELLLSKKLRKT